MPTTLVFASMLTIFSLNHIPILSKMLANIFSQCTPPITTAKKKNTGSPVMALSTGNSFLPTSLSLITIQQ